MTNPTDDGPEATQEESSRDELETEIDELRDELAARQSQASARVRRIAAFILVILSALSLTATAVSWWARSVAFNTDAFMEVIEPAVTSDEFTDALGMRIGEEAVTALDLETRLTARLSAVDTFLGEQLVEALGLGPRAQDLIERLDVPRLADLAGPLSEAANERIISAVQTLISSDAFEATLVAALTRGHEATVALVQDDLESLENVYVEGTDVRWNALPLVVSVIEHIIAQGLLDGEDITLPDLSDNPRLATALTRVSEALGVQVPDDLGQITIMTTDDLEALQGYGATFSNAVWWLFALSIVLIAVTIAISPRRRRTIIQLGVATVIAVVLAGVIVRTVISTIQERIASPETRAAAASILVEVQQSARSLGLALIIVAVIVAIVTWLAGRPEQMEKWMDSARQATDPDAEPNPVDAFVGRYFDVLAIVLVVITLVVVWMIDLNWPVALLILAVLAGLVWYGMSARARYEFGEAVEELEAEAADAPQPESR